MDRLSEVRGRGGLRDAIGGFSSYVFVVPTSSGKKLNCLCDYRDKIYVYGEVAERGRAWKGGYWCWKGEILFIVDGWVTLGYHQEGNVHPIFRPFLWIYTLRDRSLEAEKAAALSQIFCSKKYQRDI